MSHSLNKKVHPVSTAFPQKCQVTCQISEDPILVLPFLTTNHPDFIPSEKISEDQIKELNINLDGSLSNEEEKVFKHVMKLNKATITFEDKEYKNIPIPPGLIEKVIEVLKLKIEAEVYEPSQSSY
ncbi:hypothetical protein BDQ12DRAFT_695460 [Crucibulum laeve]|uniref:Uncharacterized protein n=1 Tax=Crucibulum laeve TaxID=68775 RepID=A0A5C3MCJ8_9AGAR|nr:hypothetical protein BDQ12DRAFT_695460 [Crucibulum laeve]